MPNQRSSTARPIQCATASAAVQAAVLATAESEEHLAVQTTLATLGWPALCEFVAKFALTTLGRQAVQRLNLPQEQSEVEALVKETAAVDRLETEYAVELDFGGTSTSQVLTAPACYTAFHHTVGVLRVILSLLRRMVTMDHSCLEVKNS